MLDTHTELPVALSEFIINVQKHIKAINAAAIDVTAAGLYSLLCDIPSLYSTRKLAHRLLDLEKQYSVTIISVKFIKETNSCLFGLKFEDQVVEVKIV